MLAIEATQLRKQFKGVVAVDGLDLSVDEGGVVALLGPNGAGKTTTLMMLLGIITPDQGEVKLLGNRLPENRGIALAQTNFTASYVGMPYRMRVREFFDVYATLYGVPRSRVDFVVEQFGIQHLLERQAHQLSSGQRTLVGLAKSLINQPRLLILDEPTASLDPDAANQIRGVLMNIWRDEGFTLLITSHNMVEVERLCNRVVFIAQGRTIADGSPDEIAQRYGAMNLEETFLSIASETRP